MRDFIKILISHFNGKINEDDSLKSAVKMFYIANLIALVVLIFNALISKNAFASIIEAKASISNETAAWSVTVLIALFGFIGVSYLANKIVRYFNQGHDGNDGNRRIELLAGIGIVALVFTIDVWANLQGAEEYAYDSTQPAMQSKLDQINQRFAKELGERERADSLKVSKIEAQIDQLKDSKIYKVKSHDRECRNVCYYEKGKGAAHWSGTITPFGHQYIKKFIDQKEELEASLLAYREDHQQRQDKEIALAESDYRSDHDRYGREVLVKQRGLKTFVFLAYPLALLASIFASSYGYRCLSRIEGVTEEDNEEETKPLVEENTPIAQSVFFPGFAPPTPATSSRDLNLIKRLGELEARLAKAQEEDYSHTNAQPSVTPNAMGNATPNATPKSTDDKQLSHKDSEFLKKWQEAVSLIVSGYSNREVIENYIGPQGSIGGTTIQKIKVCLKSIGILEEYNN